MIRTVKQGVWVALIASSLASWGCARQERAEQANPDTLGTSDPAAAYGESGTGSSAGTSGDTNVAGGAVGSTAPSDTNSPAGGTLGDLRSRLRSESARLGAAASAGRLDDVSASALRIRDMVTALLGKTSGMPDQKAQQIEGLVHQAADLVEKVRAHAAAGEADGAKTESGQLQGVVADILKATAS